MLSCISQHRRVVSRSIAAATVAMVVVLVGAAVAALAAVDAVTLRGGGVITKSFSRGQVVGTSATGVMTAAFAERVGGRQPSGIYTSDLRVGSWLRPVFIPGSTDGEDPQIAVAPNGGVLVVWEAQHGGSHNGLVGYSYRSPSSRTFTPAKFVGSNANGDHGSDLAVALGNSGRGAIAWTQYGDARSVQAVLVNNGVAGSTQSIASSSSGPSVAIDGVGRAILLYTTDPDVLYQALAPAGAAFGASTVVDDHGPGENMNYLRVRSNTEGQVVAGWGDQCQDGEPGSDTCPNIFYNRMGIGTTAGGITSNKQVSNPYENDDPVLGATRKAGEITEVAIDEQGNATMVWEGNDANLTTSDVDIWSATSVAGGPIGASTLVGAANDLDKDELKVAAAGGRVLIAWSYAESTSTKRRVFLTQSIVPSSGGSITWPASVQVTAEADNADSLGLVMAPNGLAGIVYRASGDITKANVNAPRDVTRPNAVVAANRSVMRASSSGRFALTVRCPSSEASCATSIATSYRRRDRRGRMVWVPAATRAASYSLGGASARSTIALNRAARTILNARSELAVRVVFTVTDAAGNKQSITRTYQVRLPARR